MHRLKRVGEAAALVASLQVRTSLFTSSKLFRVYSPASFEKVIPCDPKLDLLWEG